MSVWTNFDDRACNDETGAGKLQHDRTCALNPMTQWLSMVFDLTAKTAPACQKQTRRQIDTQETHIDTCIQRERHPSSSYQDPDVLAVESVLRACLAALKFRHSNPDALSLASLLRAFRARPKIGCESSSKHLSFHVLPVLQNSEISLPRHVPQIPEILLRRACPPKATKIPKF